MGSRQLSAALAVLTAAMAGATCTSDSTDARGPSGETQPGAVVAAHNGTGETTGLVGTDVVADSVEVTDEGPPAPTVLFTAGIKGYTEPCGCTLDLVLGGIDRVVGSVSAMKAIAPEHLVLDAGNTLFEHAELDEASRSQEIRKTDVIAAALRALGTAATVPGATDLAEGVDFYRHVMASAGVPVLAANLATTDGTALGDPSIEVTVGSEQIGVIGAVDPARFEDIDTVVARPAGAPVAAAAEALRASGATTVILLFQGDLPAARATFADATSIDFIVIGADPRETDEVERIGSAFTLQAYDQGRYVGRLKLHCPGDSDRTPWSNARSGSAEEIERLDRVIEGLEAQLAELPSFADGEAPPIVARQRQRLADRRAERDSMDADAADFGGGGCRFLYRPIAMSPGYPTAPEITEAMSEYNQALRGINLAAAEPPPPAATGVASYTGSEACAECHVAETAQWATTAHAHAWGTLVDRGKQFDRSCVGCHVTGYMRPGGSSVGHTERLEDVQCEVCHGPGSLHIVDTTVDLDLGNDPAVCTGCHNSEHSPQFDHAAYVPRIIGPGHGMEQ